MFSLRNKKNLSLNYLCFSLSGALVQKLFHKLHIIFSNSLMGIKVICQLERNKEPLEGLPNVQEIFS